MKTRDFFFNLPEGLIAQDPPAIRGTSRLLVLDRVQKQTQHMSIQDLPHLIKPGTVVVLNDSRVRKARVFAVSEQTGGTVEFLFLEKTSQGNWKTIASKSRKQKPGRTYLFPGNIRGRITTRENNQCILEFDTPLDESFFELHGHIPLPPYIKREDKAADTSRYQTVYSRVTGSAAAPTAGLHFTEELLEKIKQMGCRIVYITLHAGLGTFLPIRTEEIEDHRMHEETYSISPEAARWINSALETGNDILAIGTTTVRALESAYNQGAVTPGTHSTGIYIFPGFRFEVVTRLLTNFHTPGSTLLLLVSAFAGKTLINKAYKAAIEKQYMFFSYGDAMLIL